MKDSHVGGEPAFSGVVSDDLPDSGDLLVDVSGGVARITLNRPETLNALSSAHFRQLRVAFERVGWRDDVRVIVLTGAGRAFSAGGDLTTLSRAAVIESANASLHTVLTIRRCPKPVIAMVNGDAIGGGNEIVIACDLAVAAEEARLGQAGTRLGWAPVIGGTNFLSMSIGDKRAREVIFLSRIVPAEVALSWGWVNAVAKRRDLESVTQRLCDEFIHRSPDGLRLAKAASNFWWDLSLASMSPGIALIESGLKDEVVAEGVSAFFEKRNPVWP